jgi:hypothetical protein
MMPIMAKFYPFLYLKNWTNIHDILNISIFQFHENIAGLTESDESYDEFDDVLYLLIDGEEED